MKCHCALMFLVTILQSEIQAGIFASGICATVRRSLRGIICLLLVPQLDQDCIQEGDLKCRHYPEEHGYDVSKIGLIRRQCMEWNMSKSSVEVVHASAISGPTEGEGHASEVPMASGAIKGAGWFKRLTGVAP